MIQIQKDVLLAPFTSFRIGGPSKYFVGVRSEADVREAVEWARNNGEKIFLFGGGSNILISSTGFNGVVVHFENTDPSVKGDRIECFSGTILFDVIRIAQRNGLQGMERMAGIPGSVGGAIRGNAGAFGTETKDVIETVRAMNALTGEIRIFDRVGCEFSYRNSFFKRSPEWLVTQVLFHLTKGIGSEISRMIDETISARNEKQDQSVMSAGSFFVNPIVQDARLLNKFEEFAKEPSRGGKVPAGWLIDKLELRGKKIGGAMISMQHSNYIVNTGDATSEDVIILSSLVKQKVRDAFGVELQSEVQMVGFE